MRINYRENSHEYYRKRMVNVNVKRLIVFIIKLLRLYIIYIEKRSIICFKEKIHTDIIESEWLVLDG